MDLSQQALSFSEEGKITSKDNYRNTRSLYSKTFFFSSTKYSILPGFSLSTKLTLSRNFPLFEVFPKAMPSPEKKKTNSQRLVILFYTNNSFSNHKETE